MMVDELPDAIHAEITRLSEEGNVLSESGDDQGAVAVWRRAVLLLPEPRGQWDAATWLHASIGDAQRRSGDLAGALGSFEMANASGDGRANPFVQISLGMTIYDMGEREDATDPLLRAYMLEGEEIFAAFGSDYLQHLRDKRLVD